MPFDRPWLRPWYRSIAEGGRVLLEYGGKLTILEGAAVSNGFIPALLPLLDGTRSVNDLARELGVPQGPVDVALGVLADETVLTEGPPLHKDVNPRTEAEIFHLAATAIPEASPAIISRHLASQKAVIVGGGTAREAIATQLGHAGVGYVEQASLADSWLEASRPDLVVLAPAEDELNALSDVNERALREAVTWLPMIPYDGRMLTIGPLMVADETCCLECFRFRRVPEANAASEFLSAKTPVTASATSTILSGVAAAFGSLIALRWLAYRDASLPGVAYLLELVPDIRLSRDEVFRVPRCPACSRVDRISPPQPWVYADTWLA